MELIEVEEEQEGIEEEFVVIVGWVEEDELINWLIISTKK